MAEPLTILLLVAVGETADPSTRAITATAREASERDVLVLVRELPVLPADDRALALGRSLHASAVVEVAWGSPGRQRALLHVHGLDATRDAARTLIFAPTDSPAERGRTIGLAVASMLPQSLPEPVDEGTRALPARSPDAHAPETRAPVAPAPAPSRPTSLGVDVSAIGALALGHAGSGVGIAGGVTGFVGEFIGLRIGASYRGASLSAAQATARFFALGLGLACNVRPGTDARRLRVALRADALLLRESVSREVGDAAATEGRWLPGLAAAGEGSWMLGRRAALLATAGVEVALGTTRVVVDRQKLTELSPVRLVGGLGVRILF